MYNCIYIARELSLLLSFSVRHAFLSLLVIYVFISFFAGAARRGARDSGWIINAFALPGRDSRIYGGLLPPAKQIPTSRWWVEHTLPGMPRGAIRKRDTRRAEVRGDAASTYSYRRLYGLSTSSPTMLELALYILHTTRDSGTAAPSGFRCSVLPAGTQSLIARII